MPWNIPEFRNLCARKSLPDSRIYQKILVFKAIRARFLAEESQLVWDKLYSSRDVIRGNERWETLLKSEALVEAAALAVHSMADIMAQIINLVLVNPNFAEGKVSLNTVHCHLSKNNIARTVADAIQQLRDQNEFRYVNAFVNTVKHRRLVDAIYRSEFGEATLNEGIKFKTFSYGSKTFDSIWAKDIVNSYIPRIIDLIWNIGNTMNTYLQKLLVTKGFLP